MPEIQLYVTLLQALKKLTVASLATAVTPSGTHVVLAPEPARVWMSFASPDTGGFRTEAHILGDVPGAKCKLMGFVPSGPWESP